MSLPQTTNSAQLMQTCSAQGWEQLDHSALVKAIELIAAHPAAGL
jgi:2-hydroxy-3-oxopropionate reductase